MKSAVQTPIPQLLAMFGIPTDNFHKARRLEPRMVEWLLTDPDEDDLLTVALLMALARHGVIWPPEVYTQPAAFRGLG